MEQQSEISAARPHRADPAHERRIVPFVHDDDIRPVDQSRQIAGRIEQGGGQIGVGGAPRRQPGLAMIGGQVSEAPRTFRLQRDDVVSAGDEIAQHATQEVRVAVVPARRQRVGEIDDPQAAAFPATPSTRLMAGFSPSEA
jgi:hypothetical protein